MKNILLVLPSSGGAGRAIAHAVGTAKKESATLFALYVLETEVTEDALERLTDMGFIGERPSTELSEAITKEKRQRGYESLGQVQIKAMEEGVEFEPLMEQGERFSKILEVIEGRAVDLAVIVRKKERTIARYLHRPFFDELKEKSPCAIEVFDED